MESRCPFGRSALCMLLSLGLFGCVARSAVLTPLTQDRFIQVAATGSFSPAVSDAQIASGFGRFDAAVSVTTGSPQEGYIRLFGEHHSTITSQGIAYSGFLRDDDPTPGDGLGWGGQGFQRSVVDVLFTLDQQTPFEMQGFYSGMLGVFGRIVLALSPGPDGSSGVVVSTDGTAGLYVSGVLPAGTYRFRASIDCDPRISYMNASHSFYFAIPTPSTLPALAVAAAWTCRRRRTAAGV